MYNSIFLQLCFHSFSNEAPCPPGLPLVPWRGRVHLKLEDHQDQNAKCEASKITNSVGSVAFGCFTYKTIWGQEAFCPLRNNTQLIKNFFFFKVFGLELWRKSLAYIAGVSLSISTMGSTLQLKKAAGSCNMGMLQNPLSCSLMHFYLMFIVMFQRFWRKIALLIYLRELGILYNQHTEDVFTH